MTDKQLTREQWATILEETSPATFGELVATLQERDFVPGGPAALVEDASAGDGPLVEDEDASGAFTVYRLADADSTDSTDETDPTPATSTAGPDDKARDAFDSAIAFFHSRLDREVDFSGADVDTPRDYFREVRGWDDETIDDHRLGWAPASPTALLDHLMSQGFDREAILGTGLFWENGFTPIWQGRLVFPYIVDRQATFAISRRVGDAGHPADDAGVYAEDDEPAKYHRVPGQDCARVEEPVYGLDSLEDEADVLITEGVADAITAHEAGYACLSPVTTTFKHDDRERLLEIFDDRNVGRVVVVQDAEPPTSDLTEGADGWDALNIEQHGEGVKGAARTAGYLVKNDVDARIGELPQPGTAKVDIDDYLGGWANTLAPVLASAVPAEQHPAYDPTDDEETTSRRDDTSSTRQSDGTTSALFDLDITDVTGFDAGDRGKNPLGHHGDSEDYFTVYKDDGDLKAADHKHGVTYTPLTYLLADASEGSRTPAKPGGSLDDDETYIAWKQAKDERLIASDDPIPSAALRHVALTNGYCERADIDGGLLPRDAYNAALEHVADVADVDPGRDPLGKRTDSDSEATPAVVPAEDLLERETTLSRREAWRAASTVTPDELGAPLGVDANGDGWVCPTCAETTTDVVLAAALADGTLECCQHAFDEPEAYDDLYTVVREQHAAPLPEYIPPTQVVADIDAAYGAAGALRGWHLLDSLESDVTDDNPSGEDAVASIDPAWEDSESGERIVLFDSGLFYCREHEELLWPLQIVGIEQGLIDEGERLEGDAFLQAYALARTEYDAPLPEIIWNDTEDVPKPLYLPVLPDPEGVLGEGVTTDESELDAARDAVSKLYSGLAESHGSPNYLLTALPALGKTYNMVTQAREYPTLYTAKRKELRQEAANRADEHDVSWMHAPTLGEERPPEAVLGAAVAHVREHSRGALRDRDALLDAVEERYHEIPEEWPAYEAKYGDDDGHNHDVDEEEEDIDLDRASCSAGDGDHGPEWQLAIWTARKLGAKPRDLHVRGETIFGATPPCARDGECPYTLAWEAATDPDDPIDLLIGHPVHAYVNGARTQPRRGENGSVVPEARVVGLDEFPGDVYTTTFENGWAQHARWLAGCLDGRVDDVASLLEHREGLWTDEFVVNWLNGEAAPPILDALEAKRQQADDEDAPDPDYASLLDADLDIEGDLAALVHRAIEAAADPDRDAEELLDSAMTALRGGREGAEVLASGADDGYARPDAYWLLLGLLAPDEFDGEADAGDVEDDWRASVQADVCDAEHFDFGNDNGRIKTVTVRDRVRLLIDQDMDGAELLTPPNLRQNTVIGLDATARADLWELALGAEFEQRDIHATPGERRTFLKDVLNLRVVQTTPHVQTYSGNPTGKNFGDDIAVVDEVADRFGGRTLTRDRLTQTTAPAVVTTKKAEQHIESDLLEAGADTVEHYGDLVGSNRLAEYTTGVILGAEHYGHDEAEKWALLAGEEFEVTGRGVDLDYGSDTANALLKRMREDKVMQSILRFGRDEEGALVFAHTAALRGDVPVVEQATVAEAFTSNQRAVARAAKDRRGEPFTVSDILEDDRVDCSRRTVRRLLNEFAELGYMRLVRGHTNEYELLESPGTGEVQLPEGISAGSPPLPGGSRQSDIENTNTWFVWSFDVVDSPSPRAGQSTPILGPPRAEPAGGPPD